MPWLRCSGRRGGVNLSRRRSAPTAKIPAHPFTVTICSTPRRVNISPGKWCTVEEELPPNELAGGGSGGVGQGSVTSASKADCYLRAKRHWPGFKPSAAAAAAPGLFLKTSQFYRIPPSCLRVTWFHLSLSAGLWEHGCSPHTRRHTHRQTDTQKHRFVNQQRQTKAVGGGGEVSSTLAAVRLRSSLHKYDKFYWNRRNQNCTFFKNIPQGAKIWKIMGICHSNKTLLPALQPDHSQQPRQAVDLGLQPTISLQSSY